MLFPRFPCGDGMTWNIGETLLGKYRVERVLGQGGMGIVLAVRHVELDEPYAVKMMHTHTADSDDSAGRFLREARASARLKGEHVARVYDVGRTEDGTLFMVMEYLEGSDLKTHLAKHGRLSPQEAISYLLQACDGIGEAHELGIVHRDIKPANLFLTQKRKTGEPHVKVLDFGISKELNAAQSKDLTQSGALLGSPLYMSPEQMVHAREVDTRTDIWSLGVVLYELMTGKVPFPGETMTQVVHSVMHLEPKPIQTYVPDAPLALDVAIGRCLKKEPEQRFANVEALADALRGVLQGEPVADAALDVTVQEKPAPHPISDPLADTAAAEKIDSTWAAPSPAGNRDVSSLSSSQTERIAHTSAEMEPKETLPLATTLPSAASSPGVVSTNNAPKRTYLYAVTAVGVVVLGIVGYVIQRPATSANVDTAANQTNPVLPLTSASVLPAVTSVAPSSPEESVAISTATASAAQVVPPIIATPAVPPLRSSSVKAPVVQRLAPPEPPEPPPPPVPVAPSSTTTTKSARWGQGPL